MTEPFALVVIPKKWVEDFNQIFTSLINSFCLETMFTQELELKIICQCSSCTYFHIVKWVGNHTLTQNFEKVKKVELEMISCNKIHNSLIKRETAQTKKNVILLKTSPKDVIDPKEN